MLTDKISPSIIIPMPETAPRATEMTEGLQVPENLRSAGLEILSKLRERAEAAAASLHKIVEKGVPTHQEISIATEGAPKQLKWEAGRNIVRGAMRELGYTAGEGGKELDLTDVEMLAPGAIPDFDKDRKPGKPKVIFTQIYEEDPQTPEPEPSLLRRLFKGRKSGLDTPDPDEYQYTPEVKKHVTDEVLVVTNMNNGDTPETRTVVVTLCKQKSGKLDIEGRAVICILSEAEYLERVRSSATAEQGMLAGKYTMDGYDKQFMRETGQTPDEYWQQWDNSRSNDPDSWKSNKYSGELMDRVSGAYTEALKRAKELADKIVEETERRLEEQKTRNDGYMKDPMFVLLLTAIGTLENAGNTPTAAVLIAEAKKQFPGCEALL